MIQTRIEELAKELVTLTGKRPRRVLLNDATFRQWFRESGVVPPPNVSLDDISMSSVRTYAAGNTLEFAAADCELAVE